MVVDPDGMSARELIRDLRQVKLPADKRKFVLRCDTVRREVGLIPPEAMKKLRAIFRSHRVAMRQLYVARKAAELSIVREKQADAIKKLKDEPDDFGL